MAVGIALAGANGSDPREHTAGCFLEVGRAPWLASPLYQQRSAARAALKDEHAALETSIDGIEGFGWDEAADVAHAGLMLAAIVGSPWVAVGAMAADSALYAAQGNAVGAVMAAAGAFAGVAAIAKGSRVAAESLAQGDDVIDDLVTSWGKTSTPGGYTSTDDLAVAAEGGQSTESNVASAGNGSAGPPPVTTPSRTNLHHSNTAGEAAAYDPDFSLGQITSGGKATASQLDDFGAAQGWTRSRTASGPIKYTDENGIVRLTIKQGSSRAPGSEGPHVEIRNADGVRVDPYGNVVTRRSVGNHTPIIWDR